MKNKLSFLIILIIAIFILAIFFKSLFENKSYVPEKINNKIENIKIKDFYSDKEISLNKIANNQNYIIINIFASWCVPCRSEHEYIKNLSESSKFKIIGLNYKDKKDNAEKFLNELGNPYDLILKDSDGTKSIFLGAYGVPETFVVDSKLNIIKKYIGPINLKIVNEIKSLKND